MNRKAHTIVFTKTVDQRSQSVVPQLQNTIVQRGQHPGAPWMKRNAFDTGTLSFKEWNKGKR
jgi:hypothetical protein